VCPMSCACRISLSGEGNALYTVIVSFWGQKFWVPANINYSGEVVLMQSFCRPNAIPVTQTTASKH